MKVEDALRKGLPTKDEQYNFKGKRYFTWIDRQQKKKQRIESQTF